MTATSTPLVSILHEPMWRLSRSSACTVQNCLPGMELRVLACVKDDDVAPSILNLLEAANPTPDNPICVYLLRLVQLVGRSAPIFIAHRNPKGAVDSIASTVPLFKAFMKYERSKAGAVVVQPFTSVAPFETMHHDACALASERRISLVIIPFHHRLNGDVDQALRSITPRVLSDAPCSVGILFDRGLSCPLGPLSCHVGIVFFGGHDDREALALASRMAEHPGVVLTVMRFLPSVEGDEKDEAVEEDEEAIKEFKAGVKGGERVVYRDVVVKGVEETVEVIKMANDGWELVVVGRRRGAKSRLTDGLTEWSQWPELGVIGDMLAASDFGSSWSVLVVQQNV
ncbi:Cation/H(+) antiporter 15 [Acorus calamus]|uniref:Cation/H(+) antiporter 15 n=1 Tax=Acorus calamus TaxID=4465 RepID=A0AAV9C875_ACOCL|nr:Cation/H(+) antiporter 15 [Acorus calamus]